MAPLIATVYGIGAGALTAVWAALLVRAAAVRRVAVDAGRRPPRPSSALIDPYEADKVAVAIILWPLAALVMTGRAVYEVTVRTIAHHIGRAERERAATEHTHEQAERARDEASRQETLALQTLHREAPLLGALDRFITTMKDEPLFALAVYQAELAYWEIRAVGERPDIETAAFWELQGREDPPPPPEPPADPPSLLTPPWAV